MKLETLTTWVKLDNRAPDDPRLAAAGVAGFGFFVTAQCYVNRTGTGGFVPKAVALRLVQPEESPEQLIATLIRVGVWQSVTVAGIEGFQIHADFQGHQLSPEEIERRRRQKAEAGRKGGMAPRRGKNGKQSEADVKHRASVLIRESDTNPEQFDGTPGTADATAHRMTRKPRSTREAERTPSPSPTPDPSPIPTTNSSRGGGKVWEGVGGQGNPVDARLTTRRRNAGWRVVPCECGGRVLVNVDGFRQDHAECGPRIPGSI